MDKPQDITDADFEAFLKANGVVVVDFWAPWCGPCKRIAPMMEEIARDYAGKLAVAKMNTDDNPRVAMKFGIMSIPTVMMFKQGKPAAQIVGAVPKKDILAKLEPLLA